MVVPLIVVVVMMEDVMMEDVMTAGMIILLAFYRSPTTTVRQKT